MKITLKSTDEMAVVNGCECRVWAGKTADGTPVKAWIATVSPQTHDPARLAAFERELREMRQGTRFEIFDLRKIF